VTCREHLVKALVFLLILLLWLLLSGTAEAATSGPADVPDVRIQPIYRLLLPFASFIETPKTGVGSPYSDCASIRTAGATWYQDWSTHPPACDPGSRALAMVWSYHGGPLPEITPYAWAVQLGNEPNLPQQAGMTVAETAELCWRAGHKWPGVPKIAPAVFGDAGYLYQVYEHHERVYGQPPAWDYLAAHCYYPDAAGCTRHIEDLLRLGDRYDPPLRVFVTEWAILPCPVTTLGLTGAGDLTRARHEADVLRAWFDAHPRIVAHLWFASEIGGHEWWAFQPEACDTALVRDGRLTAWGRWFVDAAQ